MIAVKVGGPSSQPWELQIDAGEYVTGGKQLKQVQHLSLY